MVQHPPTPPSIVPLSLRKPMGGNEFLRRGFEYPNPNPEPHTHQHGDLAPGPRAFHHREYHENCDDNQVPHRRLRRLPCVVKPLHHAPEEEADFKHLHGPISNHQRQHSGNRHVLKCGRRLSGRNSKSTPQYKANECEHYLSAYRGSEIRSPAELPPEDFVPGACCERRDDSCHERAPLRHWASRPRVNPSYAGRKRARGPMLRIGFDTLGRERGYFTIFVYQRGIQNMGRGG